MYHSYEYIDAHRDGTPMPQEPTVIGFIKDTADYIKLTIETSLLNRLMILASSNRAIGKLQKNPDIENSSKIINRVYDNIVSYELAAGYLGPVISHTKLASFIEICKAKGGQEMEKMVETLEKHLKLHPVVFAEHEAAKKREAQPTQPEQEPNA